MSMASGAVHVFCVGERSKWTLLRVLLWQGPQLLEGGKDDGSQGTNNRDNFQLATDPIRRSSCRRDAPNYGRGLRANAKDHGTGGPDLSGRNHGRVRRESP